MTITDLLKLLGHCVLSENNGFTCEKEVSKETQLANKYKQWTSGPQ